MDIVQLSDIRFSQLQMLRFQGSKSVIFNSDKSVYKILNGLTDEEKESLYLKFLEMDGLAIDNVALPTGLILDGKKLEGYIAPFFKDTTPISNSFLARYFNTQEFLQIMVKVSHLLRKIHQNEIVCQDLSFENILIDKDGNVFFCDLDGCSYHDHISSFVSLLMKRFINDYRKEICIVEKNLDRISLMISFYYFLYS